MAGIFGSYDDDFGYAFDEAWNEKLREQKKVLIGVSGESIKRGDHICYDIFDGKIYKQRVHDQLMYNLFGPIPYRLS